MRSYSQLQKDILFLYRGCIKWSYTRGEVNTNQYKSQKRIKNNSLITQEMNLEKIVI